MIEVITCGDLARLGGPWDRLWQHDPRAMVPDDDVLCHCHDGSHASSAPPEDFTPVACEESFILPFADGLHLTICCLCRPCFGDVTRAHAGPGYWVWFCGELDEAIAYRDQRRKAAP
jgi:hypothetical protein